MIVAIKRSVSVVPNFSKSQFIPRSMISVVLFIIFTSADSNEFGRVNNSDAISILEIENDGKMEENA